ncbi:MAG: hypothetical protein WBG38_19660 [Nodosilinea sp.]
MDSSMMIKGEQPTAFSTDRASTLAQRHTALPPRLESALKVSVPVGLLVEQLEPEVAAFVLSKAIHIALLDQQISQAEDTALKALLNAVDRKGVV